MGIVLKVLRHNGKTKLSFSLSMSSKTVLLTFKGRSNAKIAAELNSHNPM